MTENNQAAASEDDQDVGHVGVGAYVALIITILFFSGLFYNIDGYKWLGSFDFTTLAGGFGKIDVFAISQSVSSIEEEILPDVGIFIQ